MVYPEAGDLATAFTMLGTSAEPFDRWFRGHVRLVHGIDLEEGFPASELVLDFDTGRIWPRPGKDAICGHSSSRCD